MRAEGLRVNFFIFAGTRSCLRADAVEKLSLFLPQNGRVTTAVDSSLRSFAARDGPEPPSAAAQKDRAAPVALRAFSSEPSALPSSASHFVSLHARADKAGVSAKALKVVSTRRDASLTAVAHNATCLPCPLLFFADLRESFRSGAKALLGLPVEYLFGPRPSRTPRSKLRIADRACFSERNRQSFCFAALLKRPLPQAARKLSRSRTLLSRKPSQQFDGSSQSRLLMPSSATSFAGSARSCLSADRGGLGKFGWVYANFISLKTNDASFAYGPFLVIVYASVASAPSEGFSVLKPLFRSDSDSD